MSILRHSSTPRPKSWGLPSARAQTEGSGLTVGGTYIAEWVNILLADLDRLC